MLAKKFEDIKITVNLNFQTYLKWLFVALIVSTLSYLLIVNIPKIGMLGFLELVLIYFLPSIIAFDLLAQYQKDHGIPGLPHSKRFWLLF